MGVMNLSFGGSKGYRSVIERSNSKIPFSYGEFSGPVISILISFKINNTSMIFIYTIIDWPYTNTYYEKKAKPIPGGGLYANIFCSFIILAVNREDWLIGFVFVEFSLKQICRGKSLVVHFFLILIVSALEIMCVLCI